MQPLDLQFLLPANRENNWTDVLAVLISNDSGPLLNLLSIDPGGEIRVRREVTAPWIDAKGAKRSDRLDLLVESVAHASALVVLEAKVLAPVGVDQLERYAERFPRAASYCLVQLSRFEVPPGSGQWRSLTWEQLLGAYTSSQHESVAAMARNWLDQIERFVPHVDAGTVWNDIRDHAEGDADLRARGAWLYAQMASWCEVHSDFGQADGGRSWIVSMGAQTADPSYSAYVELDEGLPVRSWNAAEGDRRPRSQRLKGPAVLVTLRKDSDAANAFDWPLLVRVFRDRVFDTEGKPVHDGRHWRRTTARASNRPGWADSVREQENVPSWLGHGYDMTKYGWRCFGARFDLSPHLTLGEVNDELRRVQRLVRSLAAAVPA